MLSLTTIDLNKNELQNARIQNLASAPASPVEGQIYYDTTLHQFGVRTNTTWIYLTAAGTANVSKSANASAANVLQVSGGTDKTIADYTSAGGIPKVSTTGVVTIASAGTDYVTNGSSGAFTNKTFDANGSGNAITNIETADLASGVLNTSTAMSGASDTQLPSALAIKTYVDNTATGLKWKASVRAATSTPGTLATSFENGDVIDGVTLVTGDRILLKDQSAGAENGIYTVNASGAPTRATDADTAAELLGMVVSVQEGTANADTAWILTNNATITLGTTALVYTDFIKSNIPTATTSVAGKVTLASQAEAEAKTDTAKAVVSADLANFPIKKTGTIGDGVTTAIAVTDNLPIDKIAQIRDASTNALVLVDITYAANTTTFTFATAPATNSYKYTIIG